jgi:hypothetical protein
MSRFNNTGLKIPTPPTEIAAVPVLFALVPFSKVSVQINIFLAECPFTPGKLLCPFKSNVQALVTM